MVNKKILASGIVFGMVIATLVGIGALNYFNGLKRPYDRMVIDSYGRSVGIYNSTYINKIVGINPGALRILVYMEAESLVCGVEEFERNDFGRPYAYACPELRNLPGIGPQFGGTPELILSRQPDVIFTSTNFFSAADANKLQGLTGIPVIGISDGLNGDVNDLMNSLYIVAEVLDKKERADFLNDTINDLISDLNERTKDIEDEDKPWIYIGGIGYRGTHGITSTECQYSPLAYINGKNSAENLGVGHVFIDIEQLFNWQQENKLDYIIVDGGGYAMCIVDLKIKNTTMGAGAGDLDCIKNGENGQPNAVMTLPYNYYSHNYATIFVNAYYLGWRFFPDNFSDIDENFYESIYEKFVGEGVYKDMEATFVSGHEGFHDITHEEIGS